MSNLSDIKLPLLDVEMGLFGNIFVCKITHLDGVMLRLFNKLNDLIFFIDNQNHKEEIYEIINQKEEKIEDFFKDKKSMDYKIPMHKIESLNITAINTIFKNNQGEIHQLFANRIYKISKGDLFFKSESLTNFKDDLYIKHLVMFTYDDYFFPSFYFLYSDSEVKDIYKFINLSSYIKRYKNCYYSSKKQGSILNPNEDDLIALSAYNNLFTVMISSEDCEPLDLSPPFENEVKTLSTPCRTCGNNKNIVSKLKEMKERIKKR